MRRFSFAVLACGLVASPALAVEPLQVKLHSVPWHVHGETAGGFLAPPDHDFLTAEADSFVYSNTDLVHPVGDPRPYLWNPGEGLMFADDVHMLLRGRLTEFHFFFVQPVRVGTRFSIAFYDNDADDLRVGPLLAGPYTVGPYVPGAHIVVVPVQLDTIVVGPDLWFAFAIQSPSAGIGLAHPPYVGWSHPFFYDFAAGRTQTFAGGVPGNFYLRLKVVPESLPVQQVTWGAVKGLFRHPQGGRSP